MRSIFATIFTAAAALSAALAMPCTAMAATPDASAPMLFALDGITTPAPTVPGHDASETAPIIDLAGLDLSDFVMDGNSLPMTPGETASPATPGEIPGLQLANFMGATDLEYSAPGVPMARSVSGILICAGIGLAAAWVRVASHRTRGLLA